MESPPNGSDWQESIFKILKAGGVRLVAYVPDAGHAHVIERAGADPEMESIVLTTEEEGVALSCGAWLGGGRCVMLMQSSGVGNCVNMFSLLQAADFPFLTIITMRGEDVEFNPWQFPMGRSAPTILRLMGIHVLRVDATSEVESAIKNAMNLCFSTGDKVAVLLSQKLLGRKEWGQR